MFLFFMLRSLVSVSNLNSVYFIRFLQILYISFYEKMFFLYIILNESYNFTFAYVNMSGQNIILTRRNNMHVRFPILFRQFSSVINFFLYECSDFFICVCYIILLQVHSLRRLMQGDAKHPQAPLGNNFRPPQPLHHRPVRTNIDFNVKQVHIIVDFVSNYSYFHHLFTWFFFQAAGKTCPSMYRDVYYKGSPLLESRFK